MSDLSTKSISTTERRPIEIQHLSAKMISMLSLLELGCKLAVYGGGYELVSSPLTLELKSST